MLTFLRKVRKSLIDSGSARKYILYAIGEIALVVIGILLAIQINNWNEGNKKEQKVRMILGEIASDLITEIGQSASALDFYFKKDSINTLILDDKVSRENFLRGSGPFLPQYAMLNGANVDVNRRSFDNLARIIDEVPEKFEPLVKELVSLYDQDGARVLRNFNQIKEHTADLQTYLIENKAWFSDFMNGALTDEILFYFLTDSIYKNMLSAFTKDVEDLIDAMTKYRARSIRFVSLLDEFQDPPIIPMNIDSVSWMLDETTLEGYTGRYLSDSLNLTLEIESEESRLFLTMMSRKIEFVPVDSTLFYGIGRGVKVLFGNEGHGSILVQTASNEMVFLREEVD